MKKKYEPHVWKEEYVVNIKTIDEHHRNFFDIINFVIDTLNTEACKENISRIFYRLTNFFENYFIDEELYLQEYNYPRLTEHKDAHQKFIENIIKFKEITDPTKKCIEILEYMEHWFDAHILKTDDEAVQFLLEKGAK